MRRNWRWKTAIIKMYKMYDRNTGRIVQNVRVYLADPN